MKILYWSTCALLAVLLAVVAALVCAALLWVYAPAWAVSALWARDVKRLEEAP